MSSTVKENYLYNLINKLSTVIFPLITFPYAARVVEAEGIGRINFVSSILAYVSMIAALGIPMYAMRQIARVKDDKYLRNKTTKEIFLLHAIMTAGGYLLIFALALFVKRINEELWLFLLMSSGLFLDAIGCEWFYQGMEDFKYITIRSVAVKIIFTILLFVLVKNKEDIYWYATCGVVGTVAGNFFNFFRLRKYLSEFHVPLRELKPFRHLRSALRIFVLTVSTSIYTNLNMVMLGFLRDNESVGLFTASTKLMNFILGFISALNAVIVPHLSNLWALEKKEEFSQLARKSYDFILTISIPAMVGLFCCSTEIVNIFCGSEYAGSILPLQILSLAVFLLSVSSVFSSQVLYPQGLERIVIICTIIGSVISVALNLILMPKFAQNGAAVSYLITEIAIITLLLILGRKYIPFKLLDKKYIKYLLGSALIFVVCRLISLLSLPLAASFTAMVLSGAGIYALVLYLTKDPLVDQVLSFIKAKK